MLDLTRWLATYYACSWGQALDSVVPAGVKKAAGTRLVTCVIVPEEYRDRPDPPGLPAKQAEVLAILKRSSEMLTVSDVCRLAQVHARADRQPARPGTGAYGARPGWIGPWQRLRRRRRRSNHPSEPPALTTEQAVALETIKPALEGDSLRDLLAARRDRQRQDGGLPERHRASGGPGARGDRAGAGDQSDAADDPPLPAPVSTGGRAA